MHMHIVAIIWQPNAAWEALDPVQQWHYLESLDGYIAQARAAGIVVLGWSRIDRSLPRAPREGYIGVFGVDSAKAAHDFEKVVGAAGWYNYFDSTNVSISLEGATTAAPHTVYARLLGLAPS
jgi:hypothetical protein